VSAYDFVPLPNQVRRIRRDFARHDRRLPGCLFGRIQLEYTCTQPVHVGSGFKELRSGEVVRLGVSRNAMPVVPGASFKGALRARYEAITHSCILFSLEKGRGKPAKVQSRSGKRRNPQIEQAILGHGAEKQLNRARPCASHDQLCAACALFGCQTGREGLRSRISVSDLVSDRHFERKSMPPQFSPNLHHLGPFVDGNYKGRNVFVVDSLYGRKFAADELTAVPPTELLAVEVIPQDTKLTGELRLFNIGPAELGGLLCALGWEPRSWLKLGGGKGLGFGRIGVVDAAWTWDLRNDRGQPIERDTATYRKQFEASEDRYREGEEKLLSLHRG
jgi:CRISPR/Cas system CSM-associated protein Csm3 (group 7 of RAMP superfamily)